MKWVLYSCCLTLILPLDGVAQPKSPFVLPPEGQPITPEQRKAYVLQARFATISFFTAYHAGRLASALEPARHAHAIFVRIYPKSEFPNGHADLARSSGNLSACYSEAGDMKQAVIFGEEAVAMYARLAEKEGLVIEDYPKSFQNLAVIYQRRGDHAQALARFEQSLDIYRKQAEIQGNKRGSISNATCLAELGSLLHEMGQNAQSLKAFQGALVMLREWLTEKEFPKGHIAIAKCLNNTASLLHDMDRFDDAREHYERALVMFQQLHPKEFFPNGHPAISAVQNNLASLAMSRGDFARAIELQTSVLRQVQRQYTNDQYPFGHYLAINAEENMGHMLLVAGRQAEAWTHLDRAVRSSQSLLAYQASSAAEAEALAMLRLVGRPRDSLLTCTRELPERHVDSYSAIWHSKGFLMRILQERHTARRLNDSTSEEVKNAWKELRDIRGQLARVLFESAENNPKRAQLVPQLLDKKDRVERALARLVPTAQATNPGTLADLSRRLPKDSVLIDIFRYNDVDFNRDVKPRYAVFVITTDGRVRRVDLPDAKRVDRTISEWRRAIVARDDEKQAEQVRRLVWQPIAEIIPKGVRCVYLATDGDLSRLPWAALPGAQTGSILLEDFPGGLAVIPHAGVLLAESTSSPRPIADQQVLLFGGIAYDPPGAPPNSNGFLPLAGSDLELRQIRQLASPRTVQTKNGTAATVAALEAALPGADFAHLATHGYFAERELAEERSRQSAQLKKWEYRPGTQTSLTGMGQRCPLAYTGVVLAGANRPTPQDSGLLSAERIVDLPLERLRLCVLSACETGLGDLTDGEGVFGLVRAFHLAGCPNVVASLWNVNDAATAALMAKFYHELWVNKKLPIEALREAQLFIYYNPDKIPDVLGERGAPKRTEALAVKTTGTSPVAREGKRADTKLWAAFVLSGVGK